MKLLEEARMRRINALLGEADALYHQAAQRLGVSDSVMKILYTIYELGDPCLLSDVYRLTGLGKQTVHSALQKLEREGVLFCDGSGGRAKRLHLTDAGRALTDRTAARLFAAERAAMGGWTDEEADAYIRLLAKFNALFEEQVAQLTQTGGKRE